MTLILFPFSHLLLDVTQQNLNYLFSQVFKIRQQFELIYNFSSQAPIQNKFWMLTYLYLETNFPELAPEGSIKNPNI